MQRNRHNPPGQRGSHYHTQQDAYPSKSVAHFPVNAPSRTDIEATDRSMPQGQIVPFARPSPGRSRGTLQPHPQVLNPVPYVHRGAYPQYGSGSMVHPPEQANAQPPNARTNRRAPISQHWPPYARRLHVSHYGYLPETEEELLAQQGFCPQIEQGDGAPSNRGVAGLGPHNVIGRNPDPHLHQQYRQENFTFSMNQQLTTHTSYANNNSENPNPAQLPGFLPTIRQDMTAFLQRNQNFMQPENSDLLLRVDPAYHRHMYPQQQQAQPNPVPFPPQMNRPPPMPLSIDYGPYQENQVDGSGHEWMQRSTMPQNIDFGYGQEDQYDRQARNMIHRPGEPSRPAIGYSQENRINPQGLNSMSRSAMPQSSDYGSSQVNRTAMNQNNPYGFSRENQADFREQNLINSFSSMHVTDPQRLEREAAEILSMSALELNTLLEHEYWNNLEPDDRKIRSLAMKTGLAVEEVRQWFTTQRSRHARWTDQRTREDLLSEGQEGEFGVRNEKSETYEQ